MVTDHTKYLAAMSAMPRMLQVAHELCRLHRREREREREPERGERERERDERDDGVGECERLVASLGVVGGSEGGGGGGGGPTAAAVRAFEVWVEAWLKQEYREDVGESGAGEAGGRALNLLGIQLVVTTSK